MIQRPQLLSAEPRGEVASLHDLLGIANAVEVEAVARYAQLAGEMERRGETETAAVFREMCDIEKGHVDFVAQRARALGQELPPAGGFTWHLPPELSSSWDEVRHSQLLTPYRALAIAVTNEERAFAVYSYLAAQAEEPEVARQAESLAREELAHAAQLRVRRRRAYHSAHPERRRPRRPAPETLAELRALDTDLARQSAAALNAIATALETTGDTSSAGLVAAVAQREAGLAGGKAGPADTAASDIGRSPPGLVREALRQLEFASEVYEEVIAQTERDELLQAAQTSLQRIVEGISLLGHRLSEIDTHDEPAGT